MKKFRVNLKTRVDNAQIKRATSSSGADVIIVPSVTLPDNIIMNRILYPADEIEKSYKTLEGTLAPLGHPKAGNKLLNAAHPQAINGFHIGAHNENVRREGGKVYLDKVIDVNCAERTEGGRRVLDAINKGQPIHTSTGLTLKAEAANHPDYDFIARNMVFDHDAILLDEEGAATPSDGVGMMVNGKEMQVQNLDLSKALLHPDESHKQRLDRARQALKDSYVLDMSDKHIIYESYQNDATKYLAYEYEDDGQVITLGQSQEVTSHTSWLSKLPVIGRVAKLLTEEKKPTTSDFAPVYETNLKGKSMDKEEMKEFLAANNMALAEALAKTLAESLKPVTESISALHDTLNANKRAEEDSKRNALKKHIGEKAANALAGEALIEAYNSLQVGNPQGLNTNANLGDGEQLIDQYLKAAPDALKD